MGGGGSGCFASLWSVACVLSVLICLLFLLVAHDLWLWIFMDIYTIVLYDGLPDYCAKLIDVSNLNYKTKKHDCFVNPCPAEYVYTLLLQTV